MKDTYIVLRKNEFSPPFRSLSAQEFSFRHTDFIKGIVDANNDEPPFGVIKPYTTVEVVSSKIRKSPEINFEVFKEMLAPDEVSGLERDDNVLTYARSVPMNLIAPMAKELDPDPKSTPSGDIAWGVKAVGADTSRYSGEGVVVAILDTGIDQSWRAHPAFPTAGEHAVEIIEEDFTGDGNGDENGHGTHCAGTIFGRDINGYRIGIARGVRKALIGKVIGRNGGSSGDIVDAITWAIKNGADIISMSLGIDFPGLQKKWQEQYPPQVATARALEGYRNNLKLFESVANLVRQSSNNSKPVLLIAAAGNESNRPQYTIAASPPAVADGFICVSAVKKDGISFSVSQFSNTGANISAPGVDIVSAKRGGGLSLLSGTSMATPHVAGVAALWLQKLRGENKAIGKIVESFLIGSGDAKKISNFNVLDVGAGLVCAPQD